MTASTTARICSKCRSAPTLTPNLSVCRGCLKAAVDQDRENREARQQLALERARDERARRNWQRPISLEEVE